MLNLTRMFLDYCDLRLVSKSIRENFKHLVNLRSSFALISISFAYRASKAWNSLPLQTINNNNISSLTKCILTLQHICENICVFGFIIMFCFILDALVIKALCLFLFYNKGLIIILIITLKKLTSPNLFPNVFIDFSV